MGESGPGYQLCVSPHYAWVQRVFSIVPGARGYLRKEKLREVDILIRRYAAERIDEAVRELEAARSSLSSRASQAFFASTPMLGGSPLLGGADAASVRGFQLLGETLRSLSIELQNVGSDLLYADSGWAPIGAAQAVREDEIRQLCEYDDAVIGVAEALASRARELRLLVEAGRVEEAANKAMELRELLASLRETYEERRKYLRFVTHEGLSAREAMKRLGAGAASALSRAKGLLARLAGRLGLGK